MGTRLNKYLSLCGLGSRRGVESLIFKGRVIVNEKKALTHGIIIGEGDVVLLDGNSVTPSREYIYLILNKPEGYVTTRKDEKGRPTVMDLLPEKYRRAQVSPVGRLDMRSTGLLFMTNDGDLAYKLTRPEYKVPKEYIVEINRPLEKADRLKIEKGPFIPQLHKKLKPARVIPLGREGTRVKITLREGKNRQIRYTMENLGYHIKKLTRTTYGTLTLEKVNRGSYRKLPQKEIRALKKLFNSDVRNAR